MVTSVDWGTLRGTAGCVPMAGVEVVVTLRGDTGDNGRARGCWVMGGLSVGWILAVPVGLVSSWVILSSRAKLDGASVSKGDYGVGLKRVENISRTSLAMMLLEVDMGS